MKNHFSITSKAQKLQNKIVMLVFISLLLTVGIVYIFSYSVIVNKLNYILVSLTI